MLSDLYYPGWQAEVATEGNQPHALPIFRTNRLMRGVLLPPGKQRVTFSYQPASVIAGACVSGAAWAALLGIAALLRYRKQRGPTAR